VALVGYESHEGQIWVAAWLENIEPALNEPDRVGDRNIGASLKKRRATFRRLDKGGCYRLALTVLSYQTTGI
jgi:hypothetical protein